MSYLTREENMKKNIREQIAELTEEQRVSILKNGKKFNIFSYVQLGSYLFAVSTWSFFMMFMIIPAKIQYEELMEMNLWPLSEMYGQYLEAQRLYRFFQGIWYYVLLGLTVAFFVVIIIRIMNFKKKYPYYSDRKYMYLKKHKDLVQQ